MRQNPIGEFDDFQRGTVALPQGVIGTVFLVEHVGQFLPTLNPAVSVYPLGQIAKNRKGRLVHERVQESDLKRGYILRFIDDDVIERQILFAVEYVVNPHEGSKVFGLNESFFR